MMNSMIRICFFCDRCPFKSPDRVVAVWERRDNSHDANPPLSGHEYAFDYAHRFTNCIEV